MKASKVFLTILALIEWFALIAQLVLHLQTVQTELAESFLRFISYFTIQTNILVAVYTTSLLIGKSQNGFFSRSSVQTGIALYIVVVGIVYNGILRQLWDSHGLQAILHDLLHTVAPVMSLIYWWKWVDGRSLKFSNIPAWLIYPAVYAILILIRGYFPNWYPYPFLDAGKYSYTKILINSFGLVLVFLLFSFLFVVIGKRKNSPPSKAFL